MNRNECLEFANVPCLKCRLNFLLLHCSPLDDGEYADHYRVTYVPPRKIRATHFIGSLVNRSVRPNQTIIRVRMNPARKKNAVATCSGNALFASSRE